MTKKKPKNAIVAEQTNVEGDYHVRLRIGGTMHAVIVDEKSDVVARAYNDKRAALRAVKTIAKHLDYFAIESAGE